MTTIYLGPSACPGCGVPPVEPAAGTLPLRAAAGEPGSLLGLYLCECGTRYHLTTAPRPAKLRRRMERRRLFALAAQPPAVCELAPARTKSLPATMRPATAAYLLERFGGRRSA